LRLFQTIIFHNASSTDIVGTALVGDLETHSLDCSPCKIRFLQPWARLGLTPKVWQDLETLIYTYLSNFIRMMNDLAKEEGEGYPFVSQFTEGCELHPNGTSRQFCDAGMDGEDFVSLDMDTGKWVTRRGDKLTLKALEILNCNRAVTITLPFLLKTTCVNELKSFVQHGKDNHLWGATRMLDQGSPGPEGGRGRGAVEEQTQGRQVEPMSLWGPLTVHWEAQTDSARGKRLAGVVGSVLGLVFMVLGLLVYLRNKKALPPSKPHQQQTKDRQGDTALHHAARQAARKGKNVYKVLFASLQSHCPGAMGIRNRAGETPRDLLGPMKEEQEAKAGRRTSIYSSVFATHPFGYRLCLRLYPDGDGAGQGTHLSLFMALAKGPYDDLLPWPFLRKVTFYLLDPWRKRPALRETFAPDPCSTSFQQPQGQLNVASGSPLFAPHGQLQNYLKDDTLYVKVVVDTSGMGV
ncbi:TNF receptor-associated factor 3, partial [Chelonia mydas]